METYYYNRMTKQQQAAYHSILTGIKNLSDEFQIPALEKEELYNVFFQMRSGSSGNILGPPDTNTAITKILQILFSFRNIFLTKIRSGSIKKP